MKKVNRIFRKLGRKERRISEDKASAERAKSKAEEKERKAQAEIDKAEEDKIKLDQVKTTAEEARQKAEEARRKADEAKVAYNSLGRSKISKKGIIISSISGTLVLALIAGVVTLIVTRESKKGQVRNISNNPSSSMSDDNTNTETQDNLGIIMDDGIVKQFESETQVLETQNIEETEGIQIVEETKENSSNYIELTNEQFENLVGSFVTKNASKYSNVSTEDILKFVAMTNIDEIFENNSELAKELFSSQSKEEYLNDVANVIGSTVMYDFNVWNQTRSTKDFIKISDSVIGSQKEQMIKIEEYVDRIAVAVNADDKNLVNSIVSEFLEDMNSGDLSKLDDGVGFTTQIYIALISDGIAKDYLNKENFDMLQILKGSEKYVSNIFAVYDKCNGSKTLSR